MTDLSRRHLIQGAVAAGAALAGSTVAVASPKQKWDEVVDVIVIGSGFAGLAAAIEAKKAGANVVVLEKMATFGGNSIINGGILTATGCPQQKLHKIEDSVELLEKDILTAGNYMNYSSKVRYLAEHALSNYEWTVKELGVQYLRRHRPGRRSLRSALRHDDEWLGFGHRYEGTRQVQGTRHSAAQPRVRRTHHPR